MSITSGTWLDRTRWSFRFWHEVSWCFVFGLPAYKTHKLLQTKNDSSCWLAYQNIRKAYRRAGKANRGRGAKYRKQPVFGIYKRNGKIFLELISDTTRTEILPKIKQMIKPGSTICSDDHTSYAQLVGLGYVHQVVNHGEGEYVVDEWHINGLEGFWGLSKTNMHTYKGIRKANWIYYLKEMEWRYNYRNLDFEDQVLNVVKLLMSDKVIATYNPRIARPT